MNISEDTPQGLDPSWRSMRWQLDEVVTLHGAEAAGDGETMLYLHGLGSSHADIAAATWHPDLRRRHIVAFDLPGHGSSAWITPSSRIDPVSRCADALRHFVIEELDRPVAIVGHSLGGAIGLLLAEQLGDQCLSYISVEGNLTDSDCQALSLPTAAAQPNTMAEITELVRQHLGNSTAGGTRHYLGTFNHNISSRSDWISYTNALIKHSAQGKLLKTMEQLSNPRSYIYGDDQPPAVVHDLVRLDIKTTPIASSGHWPMYANPNGLNEALVADLDLISR